MKRKIDAFLNIVRKRDGHQPEFMQAVEEVAETVIPYIIEHDICLLYTSPSPRD